MADPSAWFPRSPKDRDALCALTTLQHLKKANQWGRWAGMIPSDVFLQVSNISKKKKNLTKEIVKMILEKNKTNKKKTHGNR